MNSFNSLIRLIRKSKLQLYVAVTLSCIWFRSCYESRIRFRGLNLAVRTSFIAGT